MTGVPPCVEVRGARVVLLGLVVLAVACVVATSLPVVGSTTGSGRDGIGTGAPRAAPGPIRAEARGGSDVATSIATLGEARSSVVVGVPVAVAWQALDASGGRVTTFAVGCELTVIANANGSSARAWVNASTGGALERAANGTFAVPAPAWDAGVLNLTVSVGVADPVTIRLFGPLLPTVPSPYSLTALPDLLHLTVYQPEVAINATRSNDTFWHVRDRFGDPVPGAFLIEELSNRTWVRTTFVPVTWSTAGTTGAWVNYTVPGTGNATFRLRDEANDTLVGPASLPGVAISASAPASVSVSSASYLVAAVLTGAAVLGIAGLLLGERRRRPTRASVDGEEELRRLAEGRETIVTMLRKAGPLGLHEIEATWDPPPAPPAVADWVASLVTDGTLTATLGEGGRARFALAEAPDLEPRVTLDPDALERGIARRDAAVAAGDAPPKTDENAGEGPE